MRELSAVRGATRLAQRWDARALFAISDHMRPSILQTTIRSCPSRRVSLVPFGCPLLCPALHVSVADLLSAASPEWYSELAAALVPCSPPLPSNVTTLIAEYATPEVGQSPSVVSAPR